MTVLISDKQLKHIDMKKIFLILLSVAVLFSCNKKEPDDNGNGNGNNTTAKATVVRLGASTLTFEAIGPEAQTVKVYADGSWTSTAPDWVTLDPASGNGTVTVTVTVTDNESPDGRTGEVVFAPELTTSTTNKLSVQQKGDNKVTIKTGQAFAEWLASLTTESLDEARLAADIDMAGIEFVPAEGFAGDFDGGGHSIKNLNASKPIFKVNKGKIYDVVIDESCSFEPDTLVFGALIMRNEGIVEGCVNKANVTRRIEPTTSKSNLIAGLIGMSVAKDEGIVNCVNCKNYGNVSLIVNDEGKFTTQGVAGVVAFSLDELSGCENYGEITLSGGYHTNRACPARDPADPTNIETGEFYNKKVGSSLGGVVAYAIGPLDNCKNAGKVSWTESKVEEMNTSPARFFTGGVAGCYFGEVKDCSNSGEVVVNALTSDRSNFSGQNHQQCVGGVFGGVNNPSDDAPSKNRGVSVSGCVNTGAVSIDAYTSKSTMHVGGVIGWPASENDNTNPANWGTMSSCNNSGIITVSGTANLRVGGVAGATSYMENCSNTGKIIINGAKDHSEVGGLVARHWGYAQTIKNCSSNADIESSAVIDVGLLIGWIGNKQSASVEGGSFSGSITAAAGSAAGLLVGGSGSNLTATIGTSSNPVEVSGSLNGTAITSENAATLVWGDGFDSSVHSLNYVIK